MNGERGEKEERGERREGRKERGEGAVRRGLNKEQHAAPGAAMWFTCVNQGSIQDFSSRGGGVSAWAQKKKKKKKMMPMLSRS